MKFSEFLKLNEDEGGGDVASGDQGSVDVSPIPNVTDNMDYPSYPIGMISRINMPQIHKNLYDQFCADLRSKNIIHKSKKIKCNMLRPSQNEFNIDKINSIKKDMKDGTYKNEPIIVSKDNYIVDGHHRWKAFGQNQFIPVNYVDLDFVDLYEFLQNKPYVFNKNLNEKAITDEN